MKLRMIIAGVAGVLGIVRRDPRPVVWAVGALSMGAMAFARPPNVHYFAPTFVLAALSLLWALQRTPRSRTSILVWPIVLYLFWPAWENRVVPAFEQKRLAASSLDPGAPQRVRRGRSFLCRKLSRS